MNRCYIINHYYIIGLLFYEKEYLYISSSKDLNFFYPFHFPKKPNLLRYYQIPEGDWFCSQCRPVEPRRSYRRRKREESDEEDDERQDMKLLEMDGDEESEEESEDKSDEDDDDDDSGGNSLRQRLF